MDDDVVAVARASGIVRHIQATDHNAHATIDLVIDDVCADPFIQIYGAGRLMVATLKPLTHTAWIPGRRVRITIEAIGG